jgi:hypothetical protein
MRVKGLSVVVAATLLASGCATMSPEQCMVADWYALGERDALAGLDSNHLANRAKACQEAGYDIDSAAWYAGFEAAIPAFCTLDNGFRYGIVGNTYRNTCPPELRAEFLEGYDVGAEIHSLEQQVAASQRGLNTIQSNIERAQNADTPNQEYILDLRHDLQDQMALIREQEVALATARGVAIARGFPVP